MRARRLLAVVLSFVAAIAVFSATRGDERAAAGPPSVGGINASDDLRPSADTDARIAALQRDVRAGRTSAAAALADAYLQKVRETGDASFYTRADTLLKDALARDRFDQEALVGAATLAAARHDFRDALALARRARAAEPGVLTPLPILVDSLVELGRYDAAERTLQRLVDLKPNLTGYARVSYLRELYGDLPGAVEAMRLAVSAGGAVTENVAYVQSLLGGLELERGNYGAARRAYDAALVAMPSYAPAAAGRARLAAAEGDLPDAIARWRRVVDRLPLPEYVIGLGETELAAGRRADGRRDLELVRAQVMLLDDAGVNSDAELAIFKADHGSPEEAVRLARAAWRNAPSIRSADALGWALTRAGRPEAGLRWAHRALRLGTLDSSLRYHAGMAALAAGRRAEGRRQLRVAIAHGLATQPFHAPGPRTGG